MVIPERNIGRYHRGLFNYIFIPQKQWQFGITASYAEMASSDLQLMDLLTHFEFTGKTFYIRQNISNFVKNNLSVSAAQHIIDTGKLVESDNPDYPICIDNQWYFEGVEVKKTTKKAQLSSMYGEMKEGK